MALDLRRRARGGDGLRLPRPDRGARARGAAGRLRRHRLARAPHAARGDLRRREDPQPRRRRARRRATHEPAESGRERVRPARAHRQRHPLGEPARRRHAACGDRALRSGARWRRASCRRSACTCRPGSSSTSLPRALPEVAADGDKLRQVLVEPRRQRDQVLARRRPRSARLGARDGVRALLCRRRGTRHPVRRAAADLREVLPPRPPADPRRRRHRARPLHLPRARPADGRPHLGESAPGRGSTFVVELPVAGGDDDARVSAA